VKYTATNVLQYTMCMCDSLSSNISVPYSCTNSLSSNISVPLFQFTHNHWDFKSWDFYMILWLWMNWDRRTGIFRNRKSLLVNNTPHNVNTFTNPSNIQHSQILESHKDSVHICSFQNVHTKANIIKGIQNPLQNISHH